MKVIDPLSLLRLKSLHPKLRDEAIAAFTEASQKLTGRAFPRVTEALRTFAKSDIDFEQGRTRPGKIITNAPGGHSYHNFGCAFDFALVVDNKTTSWSTTADYDNDKIADWMEVVAVMKAHGWKWGGDFKLKDGTSDVPHFEKSFGYTTAQLLQKYKNKDFIKGTEYANIDQHK